MTQDPRKIIIEYPEAFPVTGPLREVFTERLKPPAPHLGGGFLRGRSMPETGSGPSNQRRCFVNTTDVSTTEPEITLRDDERQPCEVWTGVMGYHRPTTSFNKGKQAEFAERKYFRESPALREENP